MRRRLVASCAACFAVAACFAKPERALPDGPQTSIRYEQSFVAQQNPPTFVARAKRHLRRRYG